MNDEQRAERAWLAYRDQYQREHPWADSKRVARQLRKRDFIAGYLAARTEQARPEHVVKAEALREAADAIDLSADFYPSVTGGISIACQTAEQSAASWLCDRADALEVQP